MISSDKMVLCRFVLQWISQKTVLKICFAESRMYKIKYMPVFENYYRNMSCLFFNGMVY